MKSIRLSKSSLAACALVLSGAAFSQTTESPIKGRWGLSTGVMYDSYKSDPEARLGLRPGILPMLTYTYGKNQFELGPQFQLVRKGNLNEYLGVHFQYKRYFNGFGNHFVPYLYSGIAYTNSRFRGLPNGDGTYIDVEGEYKQAGINLSIGYGLEWELGKHFYLGSSVGLNPGVYSITRNRMFTNAWDQSLEFRRSTVTELRVNFNVNAHVGFRFGK